MKQQQSHVLITFDPDSQSLGISYSEDPVTEGNMLFKIIDIPVLDLKGKAKAEVLEVLGGAVVTAFERMRTGGVGLASYGEQDDGDAVARAFSIIEKRAREGDPQAQNAIASRYLSESIENLDIGYLDRAEEWFIRAAQNGYSQAEHFLADSWTDVKKAYRQRIMKKKGG